MVNERQVELIPGMGDMADNITTLLTRVPAAVAVNTDMATLLARLTAARAGYLDNINQAGLLQVTTARAGYLDNLSGGAVALASVLGALDDGAAAGPVTEADTIMAYLKQLVGKRLSMVTGSGSAAIIAVTGTGTDLDICNVTVAGIPSGATVALALATMVVGGTHDTSGSENQIKTGTTDYIHVKANAAAWSASIDAIPVKALSLETKASDYGSGGPFPGGIDIKSVVTGNGTYNFRSEESNHTEAIEATGGNLELLNVAIFVQVWFY